MKKFAVISFLFMLGIVPALASHILGGEITYKHKEKNIYDVFVTIYRDCGECKLAGAGGGSSTQDCGNVKLNLRKSGRMGCSPTDLKEFTLTRTSIQSIIPMCQGASSLCESDSGFAKGYEAHVFQATIDFDDYSEYVDCGFDLFVKQSSRASDITTIYSVDEQAFCNYAFINPSYNHNSPALSQNFDLLISVNKPVRSNVLAFNSLDEDSIAVSFQSPLRDYSTAMTYTGSFWAGKPLSVWCNGSSTCTANRFAEIPVGIYLGQNGDVIYTPVNYGEKSIMVVQIEKWRKSVNGSILLSVVRKDVQLEVSSFGNDNNPPKLIENDLVKYFCAGYETCLDIFAKDLPVKLPGGGYANQDTVHFKWQTDIKNAVISEVATAAAPYRKLQICWIPSLNDQGKDFELNLEISDNHCPVNARQFAKYILHVNKRPEVEVSVKELWCQNAHVEIKHIDESQPYLLSWGVYNPSGEKLFESNRITDTAWLKEAGSYVIKGSLSDYYCNSNFENDLIISDNSVPILGKIEGGFNYCVNDTIELGFKPQFGVELSEIEWFSGGQSIDSAQLRIPAYWLANDSLAVRVLGNRKGLVCQNEINVPLIIGQGPDIEFDTTFSLCMGDIVNLDLLVNGMEGQWKAINHDFLSQGNLLKTGKESNLFQSKYLCQSLTAIDLSSGCTSIDTICFWAKAISDVSIKNTVICKSSPEFNLSNMLNQWVDLSKNGIIWKVDGNESNELIDVLSMLSGKHVVECFFTNEFGCKTYSTATLELRENLDLTQLKNHSICQGNVDDLNKIFDLGFVGGIWYSISDYGIITNNTLNDTFCGISQLNYTYDNFGCYASVDVEIEVKCKPEVSLQNPDTMCFNYPEVELKAIPAIGFYRGDNVLGNKLTLDNTIKMYYFDYVVNNDGCQFIYPDSVLGYSQAEFVLSGNILDEICENDTLILPKITVSNGVLKAFAEFSLDTFTVANGVFDRMSFTATKRDIDRGYLNLHIDYKSTPPCFNTEYKKTIWVNKIPRIELVDSAIKGCEPFLFAPTVEATENINWPVAQIDWKIGNQTTANKNPKVILTEPGLYDVSIHTSAKNCSFDTIWKDYLQIYPSPNVAFVANPSGQVSIRKADIQFQNKTTHSSEYSVLWNFGTGNANDTSNQLNPVFSFTKDTGTFNVVLWVTDKMGCKDSASSCILVMSDIQIFVPNVFSPNQKGQEANNYFYVYGNHVSDFHIQIFNRWGNEVFSSDDINQAWDGKVNGVYCETGVFGYQIQATSTSGDQYKLAGTLLLLR
ncbi:MAG: gliding motility-associated C-terminal domain-containing protein [Flavobacteriales bacterium]|nr:gliding motility-associated C-terminal domain-containing protein [Flavobacteriales bacterium]